MPAQAISAAPSALSSALQFASAHWFITALTVLALYAIYEQISYQIGKGKLPGPSWVAPFTGGLVSMVLHPYEFWHSQGPTYGPLSWNALVGHLMIFSDDAKTTRKTFDSTSTDLPLWLHPNAVLLLGKDNMAFLNGPGHKALRAKLLPLFTPRALGVYLSLQESAIREHFAKWFTESETAGSQGLTMQDRCWTLNAHTSLSVFVGPYLEGKPELRAALVADYRKVTEGFLAFPINLPGTLLNTGVKGRRSLIQNLAVIVGRAKDHIRSGAEPACLLDFWMALTVKEIDEAQAKGLPAPPHSSDVEVANVVFDFLFAAQDASTASLCWTLHLMSQNPTVLAGVREEQQQVRPNGEALTTDLLAAMPRTWAAMKEILRHRPPATMVPHKAAKPFKISENYTVPSGSLVIPFIFGATHQGFENPNTFDPSRFGPERQEHIKYEKNYLTFGCGPHACMGQRYAMNHIMCFLSVLANSVDYKRKVTPNMDEIKYYSTIYPADGVVLEHFRPLSPSRPPSPTPASLSVSDAN